MIRADLRFAGLVFSQPIEIARPTSQLELHAAKYPP
jgi:hypothetical protein